MSVRVSVHALPLQPFVAEKANQEYMASADICVLLQTLARMLRVPNALVQEAAAEVFLEYASAGDDGKAAPSREVSPLVCVCVCVCVPCFHDHL